MPGTRQRGRPAGPRTELRASDSYGLLRLELLDGTYRWQFVAIPGDSLIDFGAPSARDAIPAPGACCSFARVLANNARKSRRIDLTPIGLGSYNAAHRGWSGPLSPGGLGEG